LALLSPRRQPKALTDNKILVRGVIAGQGANGGAGQDKARGQLRDRQGICTRTGPGTRRLFSQHLKNLARALRETPATHVPHVRCGVRRMGKA
jgi:hypothetical protein